MSQTFILDHKVCMRRIARWGGFIRYETREWKALKDCVTAASSLNWASVVKSFALASLHAPIKYKSLDRAGHMALKSLYAHFQMGYFFAQNDRLAVFFRGPGQVGARITPGCSTLVSGLAHNLVDHAQGLQKFAQALQIPASSLSVSPQAIGFTELQADGIQFSPAYFWLVHRVTSSVCIPPRKHSRDDDSFLGLKRLESLQRRRALVDGCPIAFKGKFDNLLLQFLASHLPNLSHGHSAIRKLTESEAQRIPSAPFRATSFHVSKDTGILLKAGGTIIAAGGTIAGGITNYETIWQTLSKVLATLTGS